MTIIRMLCSPAAVVLAIAACAAGAPVQVQRENIGLDNAAYSPPELAEALARTYEAIEWQRSRERENEAGNDRTRNLDHIGGGNLLRNLDHIGGGNLLRNLDHIGGGNLLRDLDNSRSGRNIGTVDNKVVDLSKKWNMPAQTGHENWPENRGTLDSIGGGNIVRRAVDGFVEPELHLEYVGGDDPLREMNKDDKYKMSLIRSRFNEPELHDEYIGSYDPLREMNKDQKYTQS